MEILKIIGLVFATVFGAGLIAYIECKIFQLANKLVKSDKLFLGAITWLTGISIATSVIAIAVVYRP